jgi:RNA polymerase sigma-70 factor (sigma-E family)
MRAHFGVHRGDVGEGTAVGGEATDAVDSFEAFVTARSTSLLRSAYLLTGDQQLAEDLVQTALAKTHLAWKRVQIQTAEAYARRVMYHENISRWRRTRVAEFLPGELPERSGDRDATADVDLRLVVRRALLRLGKRQRAVLVLRFFEDCSERETAELLGISVGTVKSQTHRALAQLRALAPELSGLELPVEVLR